MDTMELARHSKAIGLRGVEGIDKKYYPDMKALGSDISLLGSHGFANGPCNPKFQDEVISKLTDSIILAAEVGCKKVNTFTGMKFKGIDREEAIKGRLDTWKKCYHWRSKKESLSCTSISNPATAAPDEGAPRLLWR